MPEGFAAKYRITPGERPRLGSIDPDEHGGLDKEAGAAEVRDGAARLRDLQYLLYAEGRRGLLICLQAMDTGGKDGTIRHVLGYMNPQGCRVKSFKGPNAEEAAHDFLWRIHREVPARGEVVVFNRSHYEDVLVPRVHGLISTTECEARYQAINDFERHLVQAGTHILKFYLHIDEDEQLKRLRRRLRDPERRWKVDESDCAERARWADYMLAYEEAIGRCNTDAAPWFVIPANRKWYRNLVVSRIVVEYLAGLGMRLPEPRADIEAILARLLRDEHRIGK